MKHLLMFVLEFINYNWCPSLELFKVYIYVKIFN